MSEFGPSTSAPAPSNEVAPDALDDALDESLNSDIEPQSLAAAPEDINNAVENTLDSDPGYSPLDSPEGDLEASAQEGDEADMESDAETETKVDEETKKDAREQLPEAPEITNAKEGLHGYSRLRYQIKEVLSTETSGLTLAKEKQEDISANFRRNTLNLKQKGYEWKVNYYQQKKNLAIFPGRKEAYARKLRWAQRDLRDTKIWMQRHDVKFGPRDAEGNPLTDEKFKGQNGEDLITDGAIHDRRKTRQLEQIRVREELRAKLIGNNVVANEKKRRNGERTDTLKANLDPSTKHNIDILIAQEKEDMGEFKDRIRDIMKAEVASRMDLYKETARVSRRKQKAKENQDART